MTDAASALYMQAAQEYGAQYAEAADAVPFIRALSELEAGAEVVARLSLSTTDGSLTELYSSPPALTPRELRI